MFLCVCDAVDILRSLSVSSVCVLCDCDAVDILRSLSISSVYFSVSVMPDNLPSVLY